MLRNLPCLTCNDQTLSAASLVLLTLSLLGLAGCGSSASSTGGGGGGTPSPSFTLSVTPSTLNLHAGDTGSISVTANPSNGFAASVSVTVSGLPGGATVSPASLVLAPGTAGQLALATAGTTKVGSYSLTIQGVSAALSASTGVQLGVLAAPMPPPLLPSRTHYTRTDGYSNSAIYDSTRNRFYVADFALGKILVVDPGTEKIVASIAVPGALTMDETPDHTKLYAASQVGDIYAIDPGTMQVTHRYLAAEIGPFGWPASAAYVLADGRLAVLGAEGPLANVDGASGLGIWDPVTNAFTLYTSLYGSFTYSHSSTPFTVICGAMGNIGSFLLTGDRTHVILGSIDSDGTLCSLDPVLGTAIEVTAQANQTVVAASPDGNLLALPSYSN